MNIFGIVVLNYNNYYDTIECVDSLLNIDNLDEVEIVIVDNASNNDSLEHLNEAFGNNRHVRFIRNEKNLGYAAGNNVGIKMLMDENCKYICVLNNDTIVTSDFLVKCKKYIDSHDKVAFVSPVNLVYGTDEVNSAGCNINVDFAKIFPLHQGEKWKDLRKEIFCDYLCGACIVAKADVIKKVGLIPEKYFLYFEETEWCVRTRKLGYDNVCITNCAIWHKESASLGQASELSNYLSIRNKILFIKRNGKSKILFLMIIVGLFIKNAFRCLVDRKKYIKFFSYYLDGVFERVDEKYKNIYIK